MTKPIPDTAEEVSLDQALRYHKAWSQEDRELALRTLKDLLCEPDIYGAEEIPTWEALYWYVPPSGGYVGGYRIRERGVWHTNRVYLYSGRLTVHFERGESVEVRLSTYRTFDGSEHPRPRQDPEPCPSCWLVHAGECQ